MRLKITFTFLVVFGIAFSSLGQITKKQIEEQINVMETSHQSCKDSGVDFIRCANVFYKQMDSMLNVVYKLVKGQLDTVEFKQLKQEQLKWLSKRNQYFKQVENDGHGQELGADVAASFAIDRKATYVDDRISVILKNWWKSK